MTVDYFGKIAIENITNHDFPSSEIEEFSAMEEKDALVVQYEDCQQLMIWLPNNSKYYQNITILGVENKDSVFNQEIDSVMSGSVKIVIDTLFIQPGRFLLHLTTTIGIAHEIELQKFKEGEIVPEKEAATI